MTQWLNLFNEASLSGGLPYFDYDYRVGKEIIVPWLKRYIDLQGMRVGDFGCHQGGVLEALREFGKIQSGAGFDINEENIRESPFIQSESFYLQVQDIVSVDATACQFDLIVIREVLEHIPYYSAVLRKAWECLSPGGFLFVSFPPYYSPFGGHQQLASNVCKIIPYLHYLPDSLFYRLLHISNNCYMTRSSAFEDMDSVRKTRLTLQKVEHAFAETSFQLIAKDCFLLRPEFQIRYGIAPLSSKALGALPFIREFLVMGVHYLLQKPESESA